MTATERRGSHWLTRDARMAVVGLTLLAALLRIPTLGLQSYEFDEAATLQVVNGSFAHVLHKVAVSESTPPLYYVLAWLWRQVFGTGEFAFRLLPAIWGVLLVPVVYAVARELASRRSGLIAAAVVATSPYLVFYSQEARAYSLFALLSTLALWFCVQAIRTPTDAAFARWAAASVGAVGTHYFALFPLAGQVAAFVIFGAPRRRMALWSGVVALPTIPLLVLARHQAHIGHVDWIATSSLTQRIRVCVETFALGATFKGSLSHTVLVICGVAALAIAASMAVAGASLVRRADARERRAAALVGVVTSIAIAIPVIGALGPADYFVHKNLIPVVPQLAVVLGVGLGARRAGRLAGPAVALVVLAGVALSILSFVVPSMRRPDVREVSRQLGTPARDRVLVFVPRWELILEHYQRDLRPLPAAGRAVSEIDVFTSSDNLPAGTVPPGFRQVSVEHADTFKLFRFRSAAPRLVQPRRIATHTFSESGLQPVAVFQPVRG